MTPAVLKVSKDEHATEEPTRGTTGDESVSPVKAIDPRPLPRLQDRHLDVNKILARSLPRVPDEY